VAQARVGQALAALDAPRPKQTAKPPAVRCSPVVRPVVAVGHVQQLLKGHEKLVFYVAACARIRKDFTKNSQVLEGAGRRQNL
jgi:hypothetical protein